MDLGFIAEQKRFYTYRYQNASFQSTVKRLEIIVSNDNVLRDSLGLQHGMTLVEVR